MTHPPDTSLSQSARPKETEETRDRHARRRRFDGLQQLRRVLPSRHTPVLDMPEAGRATGTDILQPALLPGPLEVAQEVDVRRCEPVFQVRGRVRGPDRDCRRRPAAVLIPFRFSGGGDVPRVKHHVSGCWCQR